MRASFAKLPITRLRYPSTIDHGVDRTDWSATPAETVIDGCWYEPTSSTVDKDGRVAIRSGYTVDAPAAADVSARTDHVRIGGREFELDGDPLHIPSPTGALNSTRFTCYAWEG